ncbi:MAG: mannitol dehydrogenase, partial [Acidobacteriota bacterium]|nr:mannitol dehydrogenase [Acidobacteriota bacterium]
MKAVMYGAGNIGRGFIGQIFASSGYDLTFIDVAEPVITAINREGRYPVRILSNDSKEDIWIEGVTAIDGRDEDAAAGAIAEADIMATAVGVRVLPFIAPVIAAGLKRRFALGRLSKPRQHNPLNIIICENLIDANKVLEGLIKIQLNSDERELLDCHVGLVEASIGRMVPIQTPEMQDGNPLRICVEAYSFLPVDKAAFRGEIPSLTGMYPFDNFDLYIKRKLFVHNMGHAICAYLGMIRGDRYIYETVNSGSILYIAQNAMTESALALSAKYGASLPDLHYHIRDLLRRFSNKALGDTCARVG